MTAIARNDLRAPAANPALRGKRLAHVRLPDGRYETVAIDSAGEPCDVLSGRRYADTLRDYGVTMAPRAADHIRAVLAAWGAKTRDAE